MTEYKIHQRDFAVLLTHLEIGQDATFFSRWTGSVRFYGPGVIQLSPDSDDAITIR